VLGFAAWCPSGAELSGRKAHATASVPTEAACVSVAAELAGRILRGTMRRIADGEEYTTSTAIDDLAILAEISRELEQIG
jgi:hypothetical protein